MITTVGVPVAITPEAAEHVAKLGIQSSLEQMLDFAAKIFPEVRCVEVILEPPCETDPEPHLLIQPILPERGEEDPEARLRWSNWAIAQFPGAVWRHVSLWQAYESENGR